MVIEDLGSAASAVPCLPSPQLVGSGVTSPCLVLVIAVLAGLHILAVDWTAAVGVVASHTLAVNWTAAVVAVVSHTLAVDLSVVGVLHILAVDWTGIVISRILAVNSCGGVDSTAAGVARIRAVTSPAAAVPHIVAVSHIPAVAAVSLGLAVECNAAGVGMCFLQERNTRVSGLQPQIPVSQ